MLSRNTNILVAAAWPYANGSLHVGHLAGLISSDVIARYFRQKGHRVLMVSGSDCHGTPIVITAEKEGKTPAEVAARYHEQHKNNLMCGFGFSYDLFTTTTTDIHRDTVQKIFLKLYEKKLIYTKVEEQPYCEHCKRFLPDRYIEGTCPFCGFDGARGDQCDTCGKLIDPKLLVNPACRHCHNSPIWKETEHFYLKLSALPDEILKWLEPKIHWRKNAYNFSLQYLKDGLHDRSITRDTEWGIPIPLPGYETKRIYVWFEAVIGYLSASIEYFHTQGNSEGWKDFWYGKQQSHYYVHGKDNIPFHTIIFPAILMGYDEALHRADYIISTEYLNLDGKKFSKSRGIVLELPDLLDRFDPDSLRFYILYNLPESSDSNFEMSDFFAKNNSELVGKIGNFVHRVLSFTGKSFEFQVPPIGTLVSEDEEMLNLCRKTFETVGECIEKGEINHSLKEVLRLVSSANQYIDHRAPWKLMNQDPHAAGHVLNVCIQIINVLKVLLRPYIPFTSDKIAVILRDKNFDWSYHELPAGHYFQEPAILFKKLE